MQNLRASIEHLNKTTTALAESSAKLDGVIEKADSTMTSAHQAADDMQLVMADARKTAQAATAVFHDATEGKGALAALLGNQELADDLRALIHNLREHGVLFYRNSASKPEKTGPDATKPARQIRNR
jgi:ABC-type transporter Mla subunit MlaD